MSEHVVVDLFARLNDIPMSRYHQCRSGPLAPFLSFLMEPVMEEYIHPAHTTPLLFPVTIGPDDAGDCSIRSLIKRLGISAVIQLFEGVLLEKRILFIGHNIRTGLICEFVIATARLVVPVVTNVLTERVFPYAGLSDLAFASVYVPLSDKIGDEPWKSSAACI